MPAPILDRLALNAARGRAREGARSLTRPSLGR
jgi:hypothetical protein